MQQFPHADLQRMRDQLLFDGSQTGRKLSRFWILLTLAAIIATAGVIGDSTATVIGAMIVAPLMVPIMGIVLSVVTADARNLVRSFALVAAGAALVILIGWLSGQLVPVDVIASTNSQVAARTNPRLIDLVAALATGAVGAFALARSDVSDTLPGVAIAISLVPPLAVVGLTLEAGATDQSSGAFVLFLTNVGAIVLSGLVVMALFRVSETARDMATGGNALHQRIAVAVAVAFICLLAVPLGSATLQITRDQLDIADATDAAQAWAQPAGWRIIAVDVDQDAIVVRASGGLPAPDPEALRAALDARGLGGSDVRLELVPQETIELPGTD